MPLVLNGTTGVQDNSGAFVQGTSVASTSGTSIDFTGIPSWVKRVSVMLNGVSTNGSSAIIVQLGSGSVTTSGYLSSATYGTTATNATNGLMVATNITASSFQNGIFTVANISSNSWISTSISGPNSGGGQLSLCSGSISLSGTLDRVRITTQNGTDTFDAGTINITWE